MMSAARRNAVLVLGLRIAWGLGAVVDPPRFTGRWIGDAAHKHQGKVVVRALGAREVALHALALAAALRGCPLRPYLLASMAGDLSDVAATLAARQGLPRGSPLLTAVVGGGAAALTAAVLAGLDEQRHMREHRYE